MLQCLPSQDYAASLHLYVLFLLEDLHTFKACGWMIYTPQVSFGLFALWLVPAEPLCLEPLMSAGHASK